MCSLYSVRKSANEVAQIFEAVLPTVFNVADEVYPAYPGMVVREQRGGRILQSMNWGFPYLNAEMRARGSRPKPVVNASDLAARMWREVAPDCAQRCLIPVTAFAEPEGPKGAKTRTWFRVRGEKLFAWAGFWRNSPEWGMVYAGLMTDSNEAIRPVQDRMPVLLHANEHNHWLHGGIDDVVAFQQRTFPNELIVMERTDEPWVKRS